MQESTISATADTHGRLIAALCYIVPFLFLYPIIKRDDSFSLFHAKQVCGLVATCIGVSVVCTLLAFIPVVGALAGLVSLVVFLGCLTLMVRGATNAWSDRRKVLPVIGEVTKRQLATIQVK